LVVRLSHSLHLTGFAGALEMNFLWPEEIGFFRKSSPRASARAFSQVGHSRAFSGMLTSRSAQRHAARGQVFKEPYEQTQKTYAPLYLLTALREKASESTIVFDQPAWPSGIDENILACAHFPFRRRCAFHEGGLQTLLRL
jgi:hypothetical protein